MSAEADPRALRASEPVAAPRLARAREALSHGTLPLLRRLAREFLRPQATPIVLALVAMGLVAAATAANVPGSWSRSSTRSSWDARSGCSGWSPRRCWGSPSSRPPPVMPNRSWDVLAWARRRGRRHPARVVPARDRRGSGVLLRFANPTGSLISRYVSDAGLLRNASANVLVGIGKDAVTVVGLVVLMFYQDWALALASFVVFPIAIRPIASVGRRMRRATVNTQNEIGQFTTLLDQTFQGARHVKAYGMEAYETTRADRLIESVNRLLNRAARIRSATSPVMETLGGVAVSAVILYGGYQVIEGTRTAGTFFSFITALLLAYQPMKTLATLTANLQEGLAAAQRIFAVLDIEPEIRDAPGALPLVVTGGEIRFEAVRFTYPNGGAALNGVDLVVLGGQDLVALVGASWRGQIDGAQSDPALLRHRLRPRARSTARTCAGSRWPRCRRRHRAAVSQEVQPVRRHGPRAISPTAASAPPEPRRSWRRRSAAAADDFIRALPQRLRHAGGRAGHQAIRRPAPARGDRPRHAQERADPAAGRGDLGARYRTGAPGQTAAGAGGGGGRSSDLMRGRTTPRHRASPLDRASTPISRIYVVGCRPDRRIRDPRRAHRAGRRLSAALRPAIRRPAGTGGDWRARALRREPRWKLGKRLLRADATRRALSWFVYLYMRVVYATSRWTVVGEEHPVRLESQGLPCIAAFWHGRMLMLPMELRRLVRANGREHPPPIHMLISGHGDGRAISDVIRYTEIRTVEGSTNQGGSRALRALVQFLQKGEYVGITPDGPNGPAMRATTGVIGIARLGNAPIMPCTYATSRRRILDSWDRFHLPLPFGRGIFIWGEPIHIPAELQTRPRWRPGALVSRSA